MLVKLRAVEDTKKAQVRTMLTAYLLELRRFGNVDLDYRYFDTYWGGEDRWPYFTETEAGVAGFVFLNTWSPSGQGTDFAVAEFCVLPEYRQIGLGETAFKNLLKSRPGTWEISVMLRNRPARAFWQSALNLVDVSEVKQLKVDNNMIYRFSVEG